MHVKFAGLRYEKQPLSAQVSNAVWYGATGPVRTLFYGVRRKRKLFSMEYGVVMEGFLEVLEWLGMLYGEYMLIT